MSQVSTQAIKIYLDVVFGYLDGFMPLRGFPEKDGEGKPHNIWLDLDKEALEKMTTFANWTAEQGYSCYAIPGSVGKQGQASAADIIQMQVLLVDIDSGNTEKCLEQLTTHIGKPSLVVESGGITAEGHAKLHLYWQLSEPAEGEALQNLIALRYQLAVKCGGDEHFKSAHQPIRIPGSVYHKLDQPKQTAIRSYHDVEYHLDDLIEQIDNMPWLVEVQQEDILDFNTKPSIDQVLTTPIREGNQDQWSRFEGISSAIGYWIRRYHEGMIKDDQMWQEIIDYNQTCIRPPKEEAWLKHETKRLWQKHVKEHGEPKPYIEKTINTFNSFSLGDLLNDKTPFPNDIIGPRILTPGGMMVFGGAPKVGKSDFLLSMFAYLAAGQNFLCFEPPKPLNIFYFQAEIGYHYLRERLQTMSLPKKIIASAKNNLFITPNTKLRLSEEGVHSVVEHVKQSCPHVPDIIAIDPIRNVFDGSSEESNENNNKDMLFFLQKRVEPLRDMINPDAGIVLVHHTKKMDYKKFQEEPFQAFSGASSLRGYYTTGIILHRPEPGSMDRELVFELRNGKGIPSKTVSKTKEGWIELNPLNKRIVHQKYNEKLDAERDRKTEAILQLIEAEALEGRIYSTTQFAEKFEDSQNSKYKLGSKRGIQDRISVAATKGIIKFFNDPSQCGLKVRKSSYGYLCTSKTFIKTGESRDPISGEIIADVTPVLPTHYKFEANGALMPVENPEIWVMHDHKMEENNDV